MKPLVSICITSYNYGKFLPDAIKSCLEQTYENIEVIIIDDGSTDNTEEIVKPYLDKIKYIKQTNKGLPSARNTGIMNATGEYLLFLDADDMISPLYIEDAIDIFNNKSDIDIVYCNVQHFGERTDKVSCVLPITKENLVLNNLLPYCSLIRTSCLKECGGYNPKMVFGLEDYAIWIDLFLRGKKFYHMPNYYFLYRKHGRSMLDSAFEPDKWRYSQDMLRILYPKLYA